MRKVYLSFLGTNNYIACNYQAPGLKPIDNVRFVQEATIQWFCGDWSENDRIFIFTTKESHEKNWVDGGHTGKDDNPCDGLKKRLDRLQLKPPVEEIQVASGKNEQEIMAIFEQMYDVLEPKDILYLDITHAFRSLPLLALAVLNYAKAMKEIRVGAIGYGAMEALGNINQVRDMDLEDRNVPVFDLLPYDQILEWSGAIDRFLASGDAQGVAALANQEVKPVLARTQGKDKEAAAVRRLANCLDDFSQTITTCRGKDITETASALRKAIQDAIDQETVRPLRPLLERLQASTAKFNGENVNDGIAAARWCLEHNLIQQGFTILEETIFTWILTRATDLAPDEKTNRTLVNQAVKIISSDLPPNKWKREAKEHWKITIRLISWLTPQRKLLDHMRNLAQYRNDINHAGMVTGPMKPDKFRKRLADDLDFFSELIEKNN
ncbi:TM1812 family CRISPR-associated protein [Desulfolithobacter sp.]